MIDYSEVPVDYMTNGVRRYVEDGVPPGSFLHALFCNDLQGAFRLADDRNARCMARWVMFMENEMPPDSTGSVELVYAWIAHRGRAGYYTDA